jgi:hypothetical protein
MSDLDDLTLPSLLASSEALSDSPELTAAVARIFEYTQFLLDNDENLTRTGNLTGEAKRQLRERAFELLGIENDDPPSGDVEEDAA